MLSDEKVVDQSNVYRQKYSNSNPVAYTSDISLNKNINKFKTNSTNTTTTTYINNNHHQANNLIANSGHTASINASSHGYEQSASYENKSEDGNLSVPHIDDFYPEDNNNVPSDNPKTSTLFLSKACNLLKINQIFLD